MAGFSQFRLRSREKKGGKRLGLISIKKTLRMEVEVGGITRGRGGKCDVRV